MKGYRATKQGEARFSDVGSSLFSSSFHQALKNTSIQENAVQCLLGERRRNSILHAIFNKWKTNNVI